MKTKIIRQSVNFKASPHGVYEALMSSKKHSEFTGSKAIISRKVGGKFKAYDGGLSGTNIQLVKDKKIVQSWHCKMNGWPKDHYSKVIFKFSKAKNGTLLTFVHSGVPAVCYASIKNGWTDFYWKQMKKMLG